MSGLDVTPLVPRGRQLIQGYGDRRFRIANEVHEGSVVLWPEDRAAWPVEDAADVTAEGLLEALADTADVDILIVGCGPLFTVPPAGLKASLRRRGISLEWMDTGAACRTFNVLLAEERRVAAALIAID